MVDLKDNPEIKKIKEGEKKAKKEDAVDFYKQIATRSIIERDFKEDNIVVTFETAPNIKRSVKARRPTHKEMMEITKLSIEANKYEGKGDIESLEKMTSIWENLGEMADKFSIDAQLDKDFWENCVSFSTLQNFITELILAVQKGTGMPEDEMQKFRGE